MATQISPQVPTIAAGSANRSVPQQDVPVGIALNDLMQSTKELVENKLDLARAEIQDLTSRATGHLTKIVVFSAVAALSALPFLSFMVIGLGQILEENYWLSSLIVGVALAAIGIPMAFMHVSKLRAEDIDLFRTKQSINRDVHTARESLEDIKDTLQARKEEIFSAEANSEKKTTNSNHRVFR